MKKFEGKIVAITGGNSGIGLATAKRFAAEGAKVAILGRDQKTLDEAIKMLDGDHLGYKGDVTSVKELKSFFQAVKEKYGRVDTLFVNAGISKVCSIDETTEAFFDETYDINVKGAFFTVQQAVPLMPSGSSIVLTSSIVAHRGYSHSSSYCSSKAAVGSLMKSFAAELVSKGIRVNAVSPGPIDTPIMVRSAADPVAMAAQMEQVKEAIPMKRLGKGEEVANAVLFLASSDSSFTTGAEIIIDGGLIN